MWNNRDFVLFFLKRFFIQAEIRPSPLFFVILRSLRRRISARGGWVGLEAGRFFADSTTVLVRTTASVRQNDTLEADWDVQCPKFSEECFT